MEIELKFDNDAYKKTSHVPRCVISDFNLGTMRFKWDEDNQVRKNYFSKLYPDKKIIDIELCHSKKIMEVENQFDIEQIQKNQVLADGIITKNTEYIPVVTVADCVPLFIFDVNSGTFGALHSGWKGTGIIGEAIALIEKKYSSKPSDICVAIGPHIGSCCYSVTKERAEYFIKNFSSDCVEKLNNEKYSLSLTKANLAVLKKHSIPEDNIKVIDDCTCCCQRNGNYVYGSFRRQTMAAGGNRPMEELLKMFTVQAAFVKWDE